MLHYSLLYSALLYSATFDRCWQFVQCCATYAYLEKEIRRWTHCVVSSLGGMSVGKTRSVRVSITFSSVNLSFFHSSLSRSHSLSFILSTSLSVFFSLLYLNSSLFTLYLTPCLYLYICLCFFVFLPFSFCLPFFHPLSISLSLYLFLSSTLLFSLSLSLSLFLLTSTLL